MKRILGLLVVTLAVVSGGSVRGAYIANPINPLDPYNGNTGSGASGFYIDLYNNTTHNRFLSGDYSALTNFTITPGDYTLTIGLHAAADTSTAGAIYGSGISSPSFQDMLRLTFGQPTTLGTGGITQGVYMVDTLSRFATNSDVVAYGTATNGVVNWNYGSGIMTGNYSQVRADSYVDINSTFLKSGGSVTGVVLNGYMGAEASRSVQVSNTSTNSPNNATAEATYYLDWNFAVSQSTLVSLFTGGDYAWIPDTNSLPAGTAQYFAALPTETTPTNFVFTGVPSGGWYDPPTAYGFEYAMTDGSLFTDILGFPTGFGAPFTVTVGNDVLGRFGPGQTVDFVSLLGGSGVSSFTITGIWPLFDPTNPGAFPLQLAFNHDTASFTMTPLDAPPGWVPVVPEPGMMGLWLVGGLVVWRYGMRRKQVVVSEQPSAES